MSSFLHALDLATSFAATGLRLGMGGVAQHSGPRPHRLLELYEFEGCPFCRKVREALTALDLPVLIRPCPRGGPTYRPEVIKRGGRAMFPFIIDPNTGDQMYESAAIIDHLYRHYGNRSAPVWLKTDISVPLGSLSSILRLPRGIRYRSARIANQPLELYGSEGSAYCRRPRETLCELELPYHLINVGRGSPQQAALQKRAGTTRLPWMCDPNTGQQFGETTAITQYLNETYAIEE